MTRHPPSNALPNAIQGEESGCLTGIFRDRVNLAIYRRPLPEAVRIFAEAFVNRAGPTKRLLSLSGAADPTPLLPDWAHTLSGAQNWLADVAELVEMFRCLFEPTTVGLRLHVLDGTMCPRFHLDKVPVRLLCTYTGEGTQWLPNAVAIRSPAAGTLPEQTATPAQIQTVSSGAVALLKGETWEGNEGAGIVHRSPDVTGQPRRLVLGIDWL